METKVCTKCKEELLATNDYFHKDKLGKYGLRSKCKLCRNKEEKQSHKENKEYYQQWRNENKDYFKKYQAENKEKIQERKKAYYEDNKEKIQMNYKKWRGNNRTHLRMSYRQHYLKHKTVIRKQKKELYECNKDKMQEQSRNRVQRYNSNKENLLATLTIIQWEQIKEHFGNSCAYCGINEIEHMREFGQSLHQEHFIPLSKGGEYTHNNIIPSCRRCNSSKSNKDFFKWYEQQEFYSIGKEEKILKYFKNTKYNN